jgi:hypothetical protein
MIKFNRTEIEESFLKAENELLSESSVYEIIYENFAVETFDENQKELLKGLAGKPIVYCLWAGKGTQNLKPMYIGHASPIISRQRIRAHLTKKNKATGAQLLKVKELLLKKYSIGFSYVIINPGYMRKALEDWLINKNSKELSWNQVGKKKP